jgi:hypothetical protein
MGRKMQLPMAFGRLITNVDYFRPSFNMSSLRAKFGASMQDHLSSHTKYANAYLLIDQSVILRNEDSPFERSTMIPFKSIHVDCNL